MPGSVIHWETNHIHPHNAIGADLPLAIIPRLREGRIQFAVLPAREPQPGTPEQIFSTLKIRFGGNGLERRGNRQSRQGEKLRAFEG